MKNAIMFGFDTNIYSYNTLVWFVPRSVTNVYTAVFGSHYKIQAVRLGIKKTDSCIEAMRWRFHFFGSDCYIQAMRWRAQSYSEPIAIFRPCVGGCIKVE